MIREEVHSVRHWPGVNCSSLHLWALSVCSSSDFRLVSVGDTVIVNAMVGLSGMNRLAFASEGQGGGFMDSLPDPMKLQLPVVAFVVVVLTLLFFFLKLVLFKPLTQVMDDRDEAIRAGGASKTEAASQIEARQADYATRLKELRGQALEHKRSLAAATSIEEQRILEAARQTASAQRAQAVAELQAERKAAEIELREQVEALSASMVQHLLKQA